MFCFSGSISNIGGSQYECKDGSKPEMIAGVVGAPSSVTSIQVANLLKLFKIPQVSEFYCNLADDLSCAFLDQQFTSLVAEVGCAVIGVIEVNERHLILKFQVGPNRNALFQDKLYC